MNIPTLVVAAPSSGSGKTTVVCALAAALRRRGVDVRLFKAGPDYLDPSWHQAVTGAPSRNLDAWMTGPEGVRDSFARGAAGGDLAIIEGVMGLFDGRTPTSLDGSTAEIALVLNAPVAVVLDASGMARTAAALIEGLAHHVPGVRVVGALWNQVGSAGHARLLDEALAPTGIASLGHLTRVEALAMPERHLGLVSATVAARPGWTEALADLADQSLNLDAVRALAEPVPVRARAYEPGPERVRIGLAFDEAFHFYYADNLDLLREAGAVIVPFSPLHDATLPEVDGILLGGGYPEAHAAALSQNAGMMAALRAFTGPIYAECGGLMLLGQALDDLPMVGKLPLSSRMSGRLRTLGYRSVQSTSDTILGPAGTAWRGHEFHYSELVSPPDLPGAFSVEGRGGAFVEGWALGPVLGTYIHAHMGSNPALARNLVDACRAR